MELKDLPEYINSHLKDYSLAHAKFDDGFISDKVIVLHPDPKDYFLGSKITITKYLGWWYLDYQETVDSEVSIKLQVSSVNNLDDLHEIVLFVNKHTMHQTPENSKFIFKKNDFIKNMIKE